MISFKPVKELRPPETGSDYAFPFLPYDIQLDFMRSLYTVLDGGRIGIFESPTGTGKSLSLTCGALTWLRDYERLLEDELRSKIEQLRMEIKQLDKENEVASDWIAGQYTAMGQRKELGELTVFRTALEEYQKHLLKLKDKAVLQKIRWVTAQEAAERKANNALREEALLKQDVTVDEDEFLIANDSSDDSDADDDDAGEAKEEIERYRPVQVIFCSRTHSQLGQVVGEVKETTHAKDLRLTSLASRQSLCINADVRKLKSNALINERCLEMQKKSGRSDTAGEEGNSAKRRRKSDRSCPYYNQRAIEGLKNGTLFEVPDIEDLVKAGKREKACPYYAARAAIPDAQVLMVPYQLILHRRTRLQSGIDLRGSVLIIDEAHNLLDTISAIHSQELSQEQLRQAKSQLGAYKARYFSRFSTKNLLRINQLIFIATQLEKLLTPVKKSSGTGSQPSNETRVSRMLRIEELLEESNIFNLNLTDILSFCERSRIAQKVHGFAQSVPPELLDASVRPKIGMSSKGSSSVGLKGLLKTLEEENRERKAQSKGTKKAAGSLKLSPKPLETKNEANQENAHAPSEQTKQPMANVIRPLLSFLQCLTEGSSGDSRVLVAFNEKHPPLGSMKYLLLNPGARFEEIVQSCRSLVLAGGTMQPVEELTEQIFRNCRERVTIKSYPHVVPKDAVLPVALARGPSGKEFLFNFSNRQNPELLAELQSTLLNLCQVVPNGVVAFFSSYEYLDLFCHRLEESGNRARLQERKQIFREPRSSGQVEQTLLEYGRAAKSATGALLLSVVGGKLSEGLNFSDELGRCVVVVGLPYPNRTSPELAERMRYLDRTLTTPGASSASAGNEYYENLCMKAVNQCIGRAVRHIRDYAAVVLLDARYCNSERVRRKLPVWISERMGCIERYGQAHGSLVKFFREHKKSRVVPSGGERRIEDGY